jgi:hypothetical protein
MFTTSICFSSALLSAYLQRTKNVEELLPGSVYGCV